MLIIFLVLSIFILATIGYYVYKIVASFIYGIEIGALFIKIATIIICAMALIFAIFMLTLHYKVTDEFLQLKFGPFDLNAKKIKISSILNVVHKKEEKQTYISYLGELRDPIIVLIAIDDLESEKFAEYLKKQNDKIVVMEG